MKTSSSYSILSSQAPISHSRPLIKWCPVSAFKDEFWLCSCRLESKGLVAISGKRGDGLAFRRGMGSWRQTDRQTDRWRLSRGRKAAGTEDRDGEKGCCEAAEGEKERQRLERGGHILSPPGQRCGEGRLSAKAWGSGLDPTPRLPPAHHQACRSQPSPPTAAPGQAGERGKKSPFSLTWRKDERKRVRSPTIQPWSEGPG